MPVRIIIRIYYYFTIRGIHSFDSDMHYFSEMSHNIFGETEAVPSYRESFCWLCIYSSKKKVHICGHLSVSPLAERRAIFSSIAYA